MNMRRSAGTIIITMAFWAASGCAPAQTGQPLPSETVEPTSRPVIAAPPIATPPTYAPSPTAAVTAAPVATSQPEVICGEGWCAKPGWFGLLRPIPVYFNDKVDPTYRFGATRPDEPLRHTGVEFKNSAGTPVLAAADGEVIFAGDSQAGPPFEPYKNMYGLVVVLRHTPPEGPPYLFTLYAHLSQIDVKVGDFVAAGDVLGAVGMSGYATGSHLHFEVRRLDNTFARAVNPELYLAPHTSPSGDLNGGLAGRVIDNPGYLKTMDISVQRMADSAAPAGTILYPQWYPASFLETQENFALGDLLPGRYRIAVTAYAQVFELIVPVMPGMLTTFTINLELLTTTP